MAIGEAPLRDLSDPTVVPEPAGGEEEEKKKVRRRVPKERRKQVYN